MTVEDEEEKRSKGEDGNIEQSSASRLLKQVVTTSQRSGRREVLLVSMEVGVRATRIGQGESRLVGRRIVAYQPWSPTECV